MNEKSVEQVAKALAMEAGRLHWTSYIDEAQAAIAAHSTFIREAAGRESVVEAGGDELIAKARKLAGEIDPLLVGGKDATLLLNLAARIEALTAEVERKDAALQFYMSQFGQALEAHGIPFTEAQKAAHEQASAALKGGQG